MVYVGREFPEFRSVGAGIQPGEMGWRVVGWWVLRYLMPLAYVSGFWV